MNTIRGRAPVSYAHLWPAVNRRGYRDSCARERIGSLPVLLYSEVIERLYSSKALGIDYADFPRTALSKPERGYQGHPVPGSNGLRVEPDCIGRKNTSETEHHLASGLCLTGGVASVSFFLRRITFPREARVIHRAFTAALYRFLRRESLSSLVNEMPNLRSSASSSHRLRSRSSSFDINTPLKFLIASRKEKGTYHGKLWSSTLLHCYSRNNRGAAVETPIPSVSKRAGEREGTSLKSECFPLPGAQVHDQNG